MKKIITLVLSAVMICGAVMLPVSAADPLRKTFKLQNGEFVEDASGTYINVALHRTVTTDATNLAAGKITTASLAKFTDGDVRVTNGEAYGRHAYSVAGTTPYFKIDLGNCYNIKGFEYFSHKDWLTYGSGVEVNNIKVVGSAEDVPLEDMELIRNMSSADFSDPKYAKQYVLESAKMYRYIAIVSTTTATRSMGLTEFRVFTETPATFGEKMVAKKGETTVTEIDGAGYYEFSVTAESFDSGVTSPAVMIVSSYNAEGEMVGVVCKGTIEDGKYTCGITIGEDIEKVSAFLIKSLGSGTPETADFTSMVDVFELKKAGV